jgi:hypothetical protein
MAYFGLGSHDDLGRVFKLLQPVGGLGQLCTALRQHIVEAGAAQLAVRDADFVEAAWQVLPQPSSARLRNHPARALTVCFALDSCCQLAAH